MKAHQMLVSESHGSDQVTATGPAPAGCVLYRTRPRPSATKLPPPLKHRNGGTVTLKMSDAFYSQHLHNV
ncbi:hypothetical protein OJAV_G00198250 [Oryzias javanicus]|uniref:Uncharacterized protein n=1 Tax=Oryzias javanicus TaxID=123683 RepID=A0A3S2PR95_ORYJA|nr:hypothetical protein OJAV_G00198250 [Oryzias javanicus]